MSLSKLKATLMKDCKDLLKGFLVGMSPTFVTLIIAVLMGDIKVNMTVGFSINELIVINFQNITSFEPNAGFLIGVITLESVLVGLSIPLSMQVMTQLLKDYDLEIVIFFEKEFLYRFQYIFFFGNIVAALTLIFFDTKNSFLLSLVYVWAVVNIFIFVMLIRLIQKYTTQTSKIMLNKVEIYLDEIFRN